MKKTIAATISILLVVITVFMSGCQSLSELVNEEQTTLPFSTSLTSQPKSKTAVVEYYNYLIDLARDGKTGVSRNTKYRIDDLKIVSRNLEGVTNEDGNQQSDPELDVLNAAAKEVKALISKAIKSNTESVAFGEEWGNLAPNKIGDPSFADKATCVMGEEATDNLNKNIVYTQYYYGDMSFGAENYPLASNSVLKSIFPYPDEENIKKELEKLSDYIVLEDYDCVFKDSGIYFSSDRLVDQLDYANYSSSIAVTAHAKGVGKLEKYGDLTVYLTIKCENNYNFDWVNPEEAVTDAEK